MARPYGFTEREGEMHARCVNWGAAMGGYIVNLDLKRASEKQREPNGPDADLIEDVMILMKAKREAQYWLFRYLYLGLGKSAQEAANSFKKTEWWIRREQKDGLGWLLRHVKTEEEWLKSTKQSTIKPATVENK
jgi:hypothetical protein